MPNERTIRTTLRFSFDDVALTGTTGPVTLSLKGGIVSGQPGEPALPSRRVFLSLPADATNVTVAVSPGPRARLADDVVLTAVQPNLPTVLGARYAWKALDPRLLSRGAEWPKAPVGLVGVRRLGDFALAEVDVCPFRYRPDARELDLLRELEIALTFESQAPKKVRADSLGLLRYEERMSDRVARIVLNPADVLEHRRFDHERIPKRLGTSEETPHVIVTSAVLADKMARLAAWRTTLGLRSRVVTVEDIVSGTVPDAGGEVFWRPSGYYDGGTRDVAEAVRAFIKWASVTWSTDYVVLGGDVEMVPCRQAIHDALSCVSYADITAPDLGSPFGYNVSASTEQAGFPASSVADGDPTTAWRCQATDAHPRIELDLWERKPVNCVDLSWGTAPPPSFVLEGSSDGAAWTNMHTQTTAPPADQRLTLTPRSVRFLRISMPAGSSFALNTASVYGAACAGWSGTAYAIDATTTRIYLNRGVSLPSTSGEGDCVLVWDGAERGRAISYDPTTSPTRLGFRFVDDLLDSPAAPSATPTRYLEIQGPTAFHGQTFVLKTDLNYIPSDLYFGDVAASEYPTDTHHEWDADDNRVYGERFGGELDKVNSFTDVHIGRLPVATEAEAETVVDKIIRYEMFNRRNALGLDEPLPADFAVRAVLGAQNWFGDGPGWLDATAQGNEDLRRMWQAIDPARYTFTRLYEDLADVPAADVGPDLDSPTAAKILHAIEDGANMVALSSHGSPGYLCYLVTSDIDALVNTPGVWYGNACSTNHFDDPYADCFGERALLNPNGGAVAYMGNTRFGWTGDNPVEMAFWTEGTVSGRLGWMLDAARRAAWEWTRYGMNLLGDPAMLVWSDRPKTLTVTHPAEIDLGAVLVPVTVKSAGAPVANATVCLTMVGVASAVGETNAAGEVSIPVATVLPGTMTIAVSGKNLIPYLGTIRVKRALCSLRILGCPPRIDCTRDIGCRPRIVQCPPRIDVCPPRIDVCPPRIDVCRTRIDDCGPRIGGGCLRLAPGERELPREILTFFGLTDVVEFARRLRTPEVARVLDRLPPSVARPLRMMGERIRKEEGFDG